MILFPFIVLLFRLSSAYLCHKCATTDAVWNWVKYGLPVSQGDSIVSDDNCFIESKLKKDGDTCSGFCMTINITRADGEKTGQTIAMVRECQPSGRKVEIADGDGPACDWYEKTVNRRNVNITTCYCRGHYCNGLGSAEATKNSKILPKMIQKESRSEETNSFPWFIVHFSLISFLY